MQPPAGSTCGTYLSPYASLSGGSINNPSATSNCEFCSLTNADQFLASVSISYSTRWRDYGIGFAYIIFNICVAVLLYYLVRVRKGSGKGLGGRLKPLLGAFRKDSKVDPEKEDTRQKMKAPQDKAEGGILPK